MSRILLKFRKIGFWAILLVLVVIFVSLLKSFLGLLQTKERFLVAQQEVERLEEEKNKLEAEYVYEDEAYVAEKQLRDSLGLGKPNETVVILPDELVEKTIEERKKVEEEVEELPNWKKWWQLFF
jgi:cell division protein FtsB